MVISTRVLLLVASLLLVVRPGALVASLLLVAMPGAPNSFLAPISDVVRSARSLQKSLLSGPLAVDGKGNVRDEQILTALASLHCLQRKLDTPV